jgi:hypothetical protein
MKYFLFLLLFAAAALCAGCASTKLVRTWKAPASGAPVTRVAVLAVEDRLLIRQGMENRFVRELVQQGQSAIPTHDLLSLDEIRANPALAAAQLLKEGAPAVLIIRVLDRTASAPQAASPAPYDGVGWHDYFAVAFSDMGMVREVTKQQFPVETSLHDLQTGTRLWWAQAATVLKADPDKIGAAEALARKLVKALRQDGVIR